MQLLRYKAEFECEIPWGLVVERIIAITRKKNNYINMLKVQYDGRMILYMRSVSPIVMFFRGPIRPRIRIQLSKDKEKTIVSIEFTLSRFEDILNKIGIVLSSCISIITSGSFLVNLLKGYIMFDLLIPLVFVLCSVCVTPSLLKMKSKEILKLIYGTILNKENIKNTPNLQCIIAP